MIKLFKLMPNGELLYHEAWVNGDEVTVHWGKAGERGQSETYFDPRAESDPETLLSELLEQPFANGFRPIDEDDLCVLIVEYDLGSEWGDSGNLDKRHRLEERMNETLGWTGIGHCDGGSIGSSTMEVCCIVADFDVAKRVIEADLSGTEFDNYSRIYDESK